MKSNRKKLPFHNYSLLGIVRLIRDLIYTKLFYTKSRIIRIPFYIRGKSYVDLGIFLTTGVGVRIDAFPKNNSKSKILKFGSHIQINDYVHIAAIESIEIGNHVLIASKVFITDHNHGYYGSEFQADSPLSIPAERQEPSKPVIIRDKVWIGEHVCILPGVTIGEGSIIGAMSVVNKNIPPHSIAAGSPAKVIKKYNFETLIWEKVER